MIRSISTIAGLCLCLGMTTANAQQPHHSEVIVAHPGLQALKADIQYLLSLTSPQERAQEENVIGIIEIMELGLDLGRPFRIDILSGMSPPGYLISAAYDSMDNLIENIEGSGYLLQPMGQNFWELLPPDQGWFRILSGKKTAILSFTTPKNHALIKQLILKMVDPLPAVKPMLEGGGNIAIQLANKAQTAADQKLRRNSFAELRAVALDALQKRPSESVTQFEIRKEIVSIRIDEIERLLVEASSASAKIAMDKTMGNVTVSYDATGIPDSSFAKSLSLYGKTIDIFASVKRAVGSVLLVRANFPIDDLRQGNANNVIDLLEKDALSRMQKDAKMSASEKKASESLVKGIAKVAKEGVALGNVNSFAQTVLDAKGDFITYGAFTANNGSQLDDILALVANTGSGNQIKPAVAKIGDITIHEVTFAKGYFHPFDLIFEGKTGYIGTSKDVVWIGTGGTAVLEPLKAAISDLKEPADSKVILDIEGNILPWVKRAKRVLESEPAPTTETEKTTRRDNIRRLSLAVEAFATKDDFRFGVNVKDGKSWGEIYFNTGMLRFAGKVLADVSEENLQ
jgi:hypothetical protein